MNDGETLPEPEKRALPLEEVDRLVELLAESGVGEIRVRRGELEITVKAKSEARAGSPVEPPAALAASQTATSRTTEAVQEPDLAEPPAERNGSQHVVRSPVVGTFYRAPAPGEEPYVEIGDRVGAGQTLCIVEAMKLMNEIPADASGEVVEVLVENAKGVEYDQPLFRIRPEG
jgi:acetyl-CoA carboxylase biotin carboxyl carrier protein